MGYRWTGSGYSWAPSKAERKAFAIKMQDPEERAAYEARKEARATKRRAMSRFDYNSAGGYYVPTKYQAKDAVAMLESPSLSDEQRLAANLVSSGYVCNEKVHHDYLHIVNEWRRNIGGE